MATEYEIKHGEIVQKVSPMVERPVEKPNDHALYLTKKRGDMIQEIEIRQRELADLEAEIASFDKVSEIKVGDKTLEDVLLEINLKPQI